MKKTVLLLFGIVLIVSNNIYALSNLLPPKTTLTGKITDKKTGEALPGVTIYLPDLKTGSVTDINGNYKIENLPLIKASVQVTMLGYKLVTEKIDLSTISAKDFLLEESVAELNEIIVTGLSQATEKNRTPTPVTTIQPKQLLQVSSSNIIDAIATQPGIAQVTTGSGISKPVIRGLGYNRVVVVNDGIRQEGQQWGDEHGIEIDEFSVNKVEILKGPASLSYGSDAMAGAINLITAPTLPDGKIQGNLLAGYQSNNGLMEYSGNVAGNKKGFIWNIRYSNKLAHDYQNKYDGYVFNSRYRENALSGIIGLNKSWGYSHLHVGAYNLTPGIVEGGRDSATGKFIKPVLVNDSTAEDALAADKDFTSYTPYTAFQKIHHYKAVLNNSFIIGNGSLNVVLGMQQNERQEYGDIFNPNQYGLYFLLNTFNYDVRYALPEKNNVNISFGVNGMKQTSQNKGTEFLVPAYSLFDAGVFAVVKKSWEKLDISGGMRFDSRTENSESLFLTADEEKAVSTDPGAYEKFAAFKTGFTGISGSIGAAYQLSKDVFTKLNFSRGFRAPNIAEIGANGEHEGTGRYEIGDPGLKAENSLQIDYAIGLNSEHVTAELDVFTNHISNFIFTGKLSGIAGGDSLADGIPVYKYISGEAQLTGGEFSIDIHPHPFDWLHFENSFSYVQAIQKNQPDSTKYLPFIPAPKIATELRTDIRKISKGMANAYIKIGVDNYLAQNKFYAANGTETATPAYTLVNAGIGTDILSGKRTVCTLIVNVNNLADVAYQSHLSRLKYEAENYASGRTGVYNMGRNVTLKLLIPLSIK